MCRLYHRREEDWINLKRMTSLKSTAQQIQAPDFKCTPTVTTNLKIYRIWMLQMAPTDSESHSFSANPATVLNYQKLIDINIYLCWHSFSTPWLIWPRETVCEIVTSGRDWPDLTSESQREHENVLQRFFQHHKLIWTLTRTSMTSRRNQSNPVYFYSNLLSDKWPILSCLSLKLCKLILTRH